MVNNHNTDTIDIIYVHMAELYQTLNLIGLHKALRSSGKSYRSVSCKVLPTVIITWLCGISYSRSASFPHRPFSPSSKPFKILWVSLLPSLPAQTAPSIISNTMTLSPNRTGCQVHQYRYPVAGEMYSSFIVSLRYYTESWAVRTENGKRERE